jgi:8-oxo-dGTP pyrophosphatase MutT (NUDIX family)
MPEFTATDEFRESDHPRDADGKFGSGGGAKSVPETAKSLASKIRSKIPAAAIQVDHSKTLVGESSYIKLYATESDQSLSARKTQWDAAKGTKRGEPPKRRFIQTEFRVSDHSAGSAPWRTKQIMLSPNDPDELADEKIEQFIKEAAAIGVDIDRVRADTFSERADSLPTGAPYVLDGQRMDPTRAAGILFKTPTEHVLFLKRGDGGDFPGFWCLPGGHAENGETLEETATRETIEEVGFLPDGERSVLCRRNGPFLGSTDPDVSVDFTTYLQPIDEQFEPVVSGEHTGHAWALASEPPEPLHPGVAVALKMLDANELDIARLMAAGDLTSPQFYRNVALFDIRITGTRAAYRGGKIDEWCWRDPAHYLTDDFLARCSGLPVLFEHSKGALTSEEYAEQNVGSVFVPYIKGEEVWAIAKLFDESTIELLHTDQLSTSPLVTVSNATDFIHLDDGSKLLIEGKPLLLDHVAICDRGVWDKGGPAVGIVSANIENEALTMTEEELKAKADAEKARADRLDAALDKFDKLDAICDRLDAVEGSLKDRRDAAESEEDKKAREEKEAKDKKDAEEKEEKEKADAAAKADAQALKDRLDEMEGKIPANLTDEDAAEMADAQTKADTVYSTLGQSAPRPAAGESPMAYRRRTLKGIIEHSRTFKDADLSAFDAKTLKAVAETVYADAILFANSPAAQTSGIRYRETRTPAGHTIRTPVGHIGSFLNKFRAHSKAAVLKHPSQVARGF